MRALRTHLKTAFKAQFLQILLRFYPPFLGASIRIESLSSDFRSAVIAMPLTRLNRNYVGTHYGGSLFSMCDPFYMLMLIENLGPEFVVWDKSAAIRYRRPGRGTVRARFELSEERIEAIRVEALAAGRLDVRFQVEVRDESGELVAEIEKVLQVRSRHPT